MTCIWSVSWSPCGRPVTIATSSSPGSPHTPLPFVSPSLWIVPSSALRYMLVPWKAMPSPRRAGAAFTGDDSVPVAASQCRPMGPWSAVITYRRPSGPKAICVGRPGTLPTGWIASRACHSATTCGPAARAGSVAAAASAGSSAAAVRARPRRSACASRPSPSRHNAPVAGSGTTGVKASVAAPGVPATLRPSTWSSEPPGAMRPPEKVSVRPSPLRATLQPGRSL